MNKHILIIALAVLFASCANTGTTGPSRKVIVNDATGIPYEYVSEDTDNYVGLAQDQVTIPKKEAHVEVWNASDGKGVVMLKEFGSKPAYEKPDESSAAVGTLEYEEGYVPDAYECLGYKKGWFKVKVGDMEGYIQEEFVEWDFADRG